MTDTAPNDGSGRVDALSDGVFAIVVTLLALDIRFPSLPDAASEQQLVHAFLDLWPVYLAFVLSFLVIGLYWLSHRRIFHYIRNPDRWILWLNILGLLCITVIPFTTAALSEFPARTPTVIAYSSILALAGLFQLGLWVYAAHDHAYVPRTLSSRRISYQGLRTGAAVAVFVLAIPVAVVDPRTAMYVWFLLIPARILVEWRYPDIDT